MLDAIKSFFHKEIDAPETAERPQAGIAVAACALMLEIAHADDEFGEPERAHIEGVLARHFNIEPGKIAAILELAETERRASVDLFQFTRLIADRYDEGQKMVLAEALWGLVYADGEVAKHEAYLMRKLSHLLGLQAGYLAEARKKAARDAGAD